MKKRRENVKAELMAEYEQKVEEALDWQEKHPDFRLIELETYLQEIGREILGGVAERMVGQKESKQPVEAPECEKCGRQTVYKGQKRKRVVTQVGEVDIERSHYWCKVCRSGIFPPG